MNLCKDCKWMTWIGIGALFGEPECKYPYNKYIDPVTGEKISSNNDRHACRTERVARCQNGIFWERKM